MTMAIHVTNTAAAQEMSGFSFQINAALAERIKAYAAHENRPWGVKPYTKPMKIRIVTIQPCDKKLSNELQKCY